MSEDCRTGPPGYIGWRAGTITLLAIYIFVIYIIFIYIFSNFPQSGIMNLATDRTQTLSWLLGGEGVKTTENKIVWPRWGEVVVLPIILVYM